MVWENFLKNEDWCRNLWIRDLFNDYLLIPAAMQRDDVLHVFTYQRELLSSSLFIKSQQKLLRELKDFSSTVVTGIPDAAIFTFKQKTTSCLIRHE